MPLYVTRTTVADACNRHWAKNRGNCSGFVCAVLADCSVVMHGSADDILKTIRANPLCANNF